MHTRKNTELLFSNLQGIGKVAVSEGKLAEIMEWSLSKIQSDRYKGRGIPYIKIDRSVRYLLADIEKYISDHRIEPEK